MKLSFEAIARFPASFHQQPDLQDTISLNFL
jgi:hypothetical protein